MPGHYLYHPPENVATPAVPEPGIGPPSSNALSEPEAGIPWLRYGRALRRFKFLLIASAAIGVGAGFVATRLVRPQYEVQATIWVANGTPEDRGSGPIAERSTISTTSWPELLRSSAILDRVAERERLYVLPRDASDFGTFRAFSAVQSGLRTGGYTLTIADSGRYELAMGRDSVIERGAVGDSIGLARGFLWAPTATDLGPSRQIEFTVATPRDAAGWLRERLFVDLPRDGNLMRVTLTGSDAAHTATTLNAILQDFVDMAGQLHTRSMVERSRALELQLRYAETDLRDAETALERSDSASPTISPSLTRVGIDGGVADPTVEAYYRSKSALDSLAHERATIDRLLAESRNGADAESFWSMLSSADWPQELRTALEDYASKRAALRAAQLLYTDEHRRVRELHTALQRLGGQVIPELLSEQRSRIAAQEADQRARSISLARDVRSIPVRAIEDARLRRNLDVRAALYTNLRNRFEETRLARASAVPDVSVLDRAVPPQFPLRNARPRIFAAVFLVFCGLGVLLAILLDRFDPRFRYVDQATHDMGLHVFGTVPHIEPGRTGSRALLKTAHMVETFRGLRVSLRYAIPMDKPVCVTVTSPGPSDGKSFVASNLAFAFAEGGCRTLLIDGDVRKGTLHTLLGVERRPGLIDLLREMTTLETALSPTRLPNLSFIPSGQRYRRAPELLASAAFTTLLDRLGSMYDAIIVDSAPLAVGADSYVLTMATGAAIVVLRTNVTNRKLAAAAVATMSRSTNRILGSVVNDVGDTMDEFHYYAYAKGYDGTTEDEDEDPALIGAGTGSGQIGSTG